MAIVAPIEEVNKKIDSIKWKEPITYIGTYILILCINIIYI